MRRSMHFPFVCSLLSVPVLTNLPQIHFQNPQAPNAAPQNAAAKTPDKPADKPTLAYKALAGQSARYKTQGSLTMEAAGNKVNIEMTEIEKVTFTAVAPNGDITMERETES